MRNKERKLGESLFFKFSSGKRERKKRRNKTTPTSVGYCVGSSVVKAEEGAVVMDTEGQLLPTIADEDGASEVTVDIEGAEVTTITVETEGEEVTTEEDGDASVG